MAICKCVMLRPLRVMESLVCWGSSHDTYGKYWSNSTCSKAQPASNRERTVRALGNPVWDKRASDSQHVVSITYSTRCLYCADRHYMMFPLAVTLLGFQECGVIIVTKNLCWWKPYVDMYSAFCCFQVQEDYHVAMETHLPQLHQSYLRWRTWWCEWTNAVLCGSQFWVCMLWT